MSEPFLRTPFSFQKRKSVSSQKENHPKKKTQENAGDATLKKVLCGKVSFPEGFLFKKEKVFHPKKKIIPKRKRLGCDFKESAMWKSFFPRGLSFQRKGSMMRILSADHLL